MEVPIQRYTTELVPARERFAYWREAICAVYVRLDAEPGCAAAFDGRVAVQTWDGVRLSLVQADGQLVRRPRADSSADCLLSLQLSGTGTITQSGRSAVLRPGDIALYDAARPYELAFPDRFEQLVVQFTREDLLDRDVDVEHRTGVRFPAELAMTAITVGLLRAMYDHPTGLAGPTRGLLAAQLLDCIATAVAPNEAPTRDGALRTAVMTYVHRRLGSQQLSVAQVARVFGMSTRSLQRLFADGEPALSDRIRSLRLRRATRSLAEHRDRSVARVAAENGFSDAAHFARVFRAEHGCSPTQFRARLAQDTVSQPDSAAVASVLDVG